MMENSININNQSDLLTSDDQLCYQLRKILFHNSAGANCFSLETDKNTLLNGTNGKGKTSKLNAIQIGFLPHTSFKNIEKKYHFVNSEGEHFTDHDSYYYHFPDSNSVIAFEFKNTYGVFTQLVYRGQDHLSIERAFLPSSLDDIYDWFWTFSEGDELGTPTHITYSSLIKKIKSVKGHRFSKTVQENKKIMFNRTLVDEELARFSIAPISENKIDNLIDVFKLAVNATSINDRLIKKTVVSLIESTYINNAKDKTNFTPTQLLEEFDKLEKDRVSLNNRRNFENDYKGVTKSFNSLRDLSGQINIKYNQLARSLSRYIETKALEMGAWDVKKKKEELDKSKVSESRDQIKTKFDQQTGSFRAKSKDVNKRKPRVEQYQDMLFGEESDVILFNGNVTAIETHWENYLSELIKQLEPYKDMLKTRDEVEKLKVELQRYELEISGLDQALSRNTELLIGNSSLRNPGVLLAINDAFGLLPDDLDDGDIDKLNQLTDLFVSNNKQAIYKDIPFGTITESISLSVETIALQLENKELERDKLFKEISKLNAALGEDWQDKKQELLDEQRRTRNDLILLREVSRYLDEYHTDTQELDVAKKELNSLKDQMGEFEKEKSKHDGNIREFDSKFGSEKAKKRQAEGIEIALNNLKATKKYTPPYEIEGIDLINEPHEGYLNILISLFDEVGKDKQVILSGLRLMVENHIIDDANSTLMNSSIDFKQLYKGLFSDCQTIYESLEQDEEQLNESAKAHGQVTLDLTKGLSHQISHFKNYIKRLTSELNTFKLSNVDAMRLDLVIEPAVSAFIESVDSLGIGADDALNAIEKGLFNQVRKFIESMGIHSQSEFVLTGVKLVKSIHLEYQVNGQWERKGGSTGTALTSSAMLLSLFIKEMMGNDYSLTIPLNVDETSNLDFANLESICEFIKERNLVLFSASPDIPLCADDIFERFINLDDTDVYDLGKLVSDKFRSTYHYQLDDTLPLGNSPSND